MHIKNRPQLNRTLKTQDLLYNQWRTSVKTLSRKKMLKMSSFSSLVMKTHVSALRVRQQIAIQGLNSDHFCCVDERKIFGLHVFLNVELKFWSVYSILIFLSSSLISRFWFFMYHIGKLLKLRQGSFFKLLFFYLSFSFPSVRTWSYCHPYAQTDTADRYTQKKLVLSSVGFLFLRF